MRGEPGGDARGPGLDQCPLVNDDPVAGDILYLEEAGARQRLPGATHLERPGQRLMPIPHPARLLVSLLVGKSRHPLDKGVEKQLWEAGDPHQQVVHSLSVFGFTQTAVAGALGNAQLSGGALSLATARPRPAPSDGHGIPYGHHHLVGRPLRSEGAEVGEPIITDRPDDGEAGETVTGDLEKVRRLGWAGAPVVAGSVSVDESELGHLRLEHGVADPVLERVQFPHEVGDRSPFVAVEVLANPRSQVGSLPDVDGGAMPVSEDVDAWSAGKTLGEADLGEVRGSFCGGELEQVVEIGDTQRAHPLEERMKDVSRGLGVL